MNPFALRTLPPWAGPLPKVSGSLAATLVLPVPAESQALLEPDHAAGYLERTYRMMKGEFRGDFEILLAPYGARPPFEGGLLRRLLEVTQGRRPFRWLPGPHEGPGSAVREGVLSSRGRSVMVGNLEYYYETDFFTQAHRLLRQDPSLTGVRANRRLPDAEFMVPVKLLSMVYRRHLLGLLLTRAWAALFSIGISDALSGAYVLRRDFALRAFNRVTCPWFLYGAELAVLAKANGLHLQDIPAHFFMEVEKSRLRLWGEIFKVLRWTLRLFVRVRRGEYRFLDRKGNILTADDWGLSPGVNEGILQLARLGRLKRVSVLSGGRYASYKLQELKRIPGMEFGLHFNLTCPEAGGLFPTPFRFFWAWVMDGILGRGRTRRKVRWMLEDQLRDLRQLGIRPVRFDGHHHVHAVPGFLGEVADILRDAGVREVRAPYHPSLWFTGRAVIAFLGWSLRPVLARLGFESPPFFYPSRTDFSSFNRLAAALNRVADSSVLVHPSSRNDISDAAPSDTYREERVGEFKLLRLLPMEPPRRGRAP